jgi:hypothetical protein
VHVAAFVDELVVFAGVQPHAAEFAGVPAYVVAAPDDVRLYFADYAEPVYSFAE